jgi:hypothetical protein
MVYIRKKREDNRSFFRKYAHVLLTPVIAGVALVLVFLFMYGKGNLTLPGAEAPMNAEMWEFAGTALPDVSARPVYPYSVIPGGAYSRKELADKIDSDPVVASHFVNFRIGDTRMVRAVETRLMHVAYRLDDKVYWTANPVRIPAGEMLITDGQFEARARCGNFVSASPQTPVSDEEPLVEVMDIPEFAMVTPPAFPTPMLPALPHMAPMPPDQSADPLLASLPGPHGFTEPAYNRPRFYLGRPPTIVPEPGVLVLMLSGLAVLGMIGFFRRKKD